MDKAGEIEDAVRRHVDVLMEMTPWLDVTPVLGGVHVKDLPDGRCVDVMRMLFNWRVVRSDQAHIGMDRGWCYEGTGLETYLRAVGQALTWDGADDTEPEGWIKRAIPFDGHP